MANITLTNTSLTPTSLTIKCASVTPNYKANLVVKPNANKEGPVEAQTQSFENPTYTLGNVHYLLDNTNSIQQSHLLELLRLKYDGSNYSTLTVTYGDNDTVLADVLGATSGIKVVLETFGYPINVTDTRKGYMPVGNIIFRETE